MDTLKEIESVLSLTSLIVEEISFSRNPSLVQEVDMYNSKFGFGREIEYTDDNENEAIVSLSMSMEYDDGGLDLFIKMSGRFKVDCNIGGDLKRELFERNAVSIMFPYMRGQLSILTAQPGLKPVVLPAINILSLLEKDD